MLIDKANEQAVINLIQEDGFDKKAYFLKDYDGYTAFHYAIKNKYSDRLVTELLKHLLPVANEMDFTLSVTDDDHDSNAWFEIVQLDQYQETVRNILLQNATNGVILAEARDLQGRVAVNIASPKNRKLLLQSTYLYGIYELITSRTIPHYISETCVVHIALDHSVGSSVVAEEKPNRVALKFTRPV